MNKLPQFAFKSYCWAVGTTSFRTVDFNVRIEQQLDLLNEFWKLPKNTSRLWRNVQLDYYRFMQEHDFVKNDAPNPRKDAREKTSGLAAIGLIDGDRKLTSAGKALLAIAEGGNFSKNNLLQIPNDSFIYLKQLLKTSNNVDGNIVRPFIVSIYTLLRLGHLSNDEFAYLLPLCTTRENTETVINKITKLRKGIGSIDGIIKSRLMAMENYKAALEYFLSTDDVTENVITAIGINRKSSSSGSKAYDKLYYPFYIVLRDVVLNRNSNAVLQLYEKSKKLKNKLGILWRKFLFNTTARRKLKHEGLAALNDVPLLRAASENEFKRLFFEQMHLFKARATLNDYFDLNRRYFKTTDTVIFADGKVELDVLPRCWLYSIENDLLEAAFSPSANLTWNIELHEIAPFLVIDEHRLHVNLETLYGISVTTTADANRIINDERYKRFNAMIDERFNRVALIDLFGKFERREDDDIRQAVTNNADIPTIFEYILGIAWYLISGRCGDILSYMKLSLEADLLPRTHATGGNADIEYKYEKTAIYPTHTLLIEATLTDSKNQRRAEIEPVSRHLGDYILSTGEINSYCMFVSTYLHHNVISDFRNRQTYQHYSDQYENAVNGLKILPLAIAELRTILESEIGYEQLYSLFETAYHSNEPVPTWYDLEIANNIHQKC
jgi:hypothetical protein